MKIEMKTSRLLRTPTSNNFYKKKPSSKMVASLKNSKKIHWKNLKIHKKKKTLKTRGNQYRKILKIREYLLHKNIRRQKMIRRNHRVEILIIN